MYVGLENFKQKSLLEPSSSYDQLKTIYQISVYKQPIVQDMAIFSINSSAQFYLILKFLYISGATIDLLSNFSESEMHMICKFFEFS